jgi:tetratricopeptide (TPR) repeat protein
VVRLLGSLAFALVAPAAARAQEPPPEARELYERGQQFYEEGRYREAIDALDQAYALDPTGTILLYNIGLIYEKLGEIDKAVEYYRRYLEHEVPDDERARVEGVIHRLEGARPQVQERDPQTPPPRPVPPPPPRPREYGRADGLFWVAGGASAAALVAGGLLGGLALSSDADAKNLVAANADDLALRRDLAATAYHEAIAADLAFVGAIVLGAASALLYFLREREPPVKVQATSGGVAVQWSAP